MAELSVEHLDIMLGRDKASFGEEGYQGLISRPLTSGSLLHSTV